MPVVTLGPTYNEYKDAKEIARFKWVLIITELFIIAINDYDATGSKWDQVYFLSLQPQD